MKKILFLTMLLVSALIGCETEDDDQENQNIELTGLTKLSEGFAQGAGAWVEIWADKNYYVGYNNIVVAIYDSADQKRQITDGHITLLPMMTMDHLKSMDHSHHAVPMVHMHSTPVENPKGITDGGFFIGAITFIMPTHEIGNWTLEVDFHNHTNGNHGKAHFEITVEALEDALIKSFIADDDTFFLALVHPFNPQVGVNDMELALYQRNGPMSYPAKDDITISMTPEMPSMGHGSPNNVDPISVGNGHYEGQVNFTMTGWWKLNLLLTESGDTLKQTYFDVNF